MNQGTIRIKTISIKDLYQFALGFEDSDSFDHVFPIALSRARAQSNNPYAKPEDVALIVAFIKRECVGYIGRIPGLLIIDNKWYRIFWGSTFYVTGKYRRQGIGKQLLDKLISLKQDFVVTRITPKAKNVLKFYGMEVLGSLDYYQFRVERVHFFGKLVDIFRQTSRTEKSRRNMQGGKLKGWFEKVVYGLEKCFFYSATAFLVNKMVGQYRFLITNKIRASDFFEQTPCHSPFFYRGPELINWMLREKWVLSCDDYTPRESKYHFSETRRFFTYVALKIYDKNYRNYKGFIVLSLSSHKGKTVLKVLDHIFKSSDVIPAACAVALHYARYHRADHLEFPEKMGYYLNRQVIFRKFLKRQKREYFYYPGNEFSPLKQAKNRIFFSYCDGDTAFT